MTRSLIELDPDVFAAYFDRKPFHLRHALTDHPLFALPRLMQLARALPEEFVEYNAGALPVGVRPEETPRNCSLRKRRCGASPSAAPGWC